MPTQPLPGPGPPGQSESDKEVVKGVPVVTSDTRPERSPAPAIRSQAASSGPFSVTLCGRVELPGFPHRLLSACRACPGNPTSGKLSRGDQGCAERLHDMIVLLHVTGRRANWEQPGCPAVGEQLSHPQGARRGVCGHRSHMVQAAYEKFTPSEGVKRATNSVIL